MLVNRLQKGGGPCLGLFSRKAAPKVRLAGRVGSRPVHEVIDRASLNN